MATMNTGVLDTTDILSANAIVDMDGAINYLEDDQVSVSKALSKTKNTREVGNSTFDWMNSEIRPKQDAINDGAGIASGVLTATVDNGDYFNINDLVKVPRTGEVLLVTGISSNVLTVTRAFGTTAAAALVNNDPLYIMSSAFSEGTSLRDSSDNLIATSVKETQVTNYTQIIKDAWGVTGTELNSANYSGDERKRRQKEKFLEHERAKNHMLLHGEKKISGTRRASGGLVSNITTNVDSSNVTTSAGLDTALLPMFRYGSMRKCMIGSRKVANKIVSFADGQQRIAPGDNAYGVNITRWTGAFGEVDIITDHALEGTIWDDVALVLDMDQVKKVNLRGRNTKLYEGINPPDLDGVFDAYMFEGACQWGNEQLHGKFTDFLA